MKSFSSNKCNLFAYIPRLMGLISVNLLFLVIFSSVAQAAEKVILKYSILQQSISVPELSTFVKTGQLSPSLDAYLKMAKKDPKELQKLLTNTIPVEGVVLSKVLNSFAGEFLLDQVGEVIHTPSKRDSRQALRGALVTSALPDNNIRLIEVLENYPTSEVYVEGDRLAEAYQKLDKLAGQIPKLPF